MSRQRWLVGRCATASPAPSEHHLVSPSFFVDLSFRTESLAKRVVNWRDQDNDTTPHRLALMEPVGTTLGVLGLAGLLSVCLDCFHYIQDGRSLGKDFAFLEGQLSAHRIRLYAWAHACGFTRSDGRYDSRLDSPVWQQHIRKQLSAVALLFLDADKIVRRYEPQERHPAGQPSAGLITEGSNAQFINGGFHRYLARIRATKKRAGLLGSFAWALVYKSEFTRLVDQLRECIEALELVTKNFDLFEVEKRIVETEIENVVDMEVLQNMIAAPGASDADSDVVSDAASQRLLRIAGNSTVSVRRSSVSETFVTAPTRPDTELRDVVETGELVMRDGFQESDEDMVDERAQHIRIMESVIAAADFSPTSTQPIALSDRFWGEKLAPLQAKDNEFLDLEQHGLLRQPGAAKRISKELLDIFRNKPDFFCTARVLELTASGLPQMRFSFEGPPQSPYSGGIFHLLVDYPIEYPFRPPKIRFITRIYHPNIDAHGTICMDVLAEGWGAYYTMSKVLLCLLSVLSDPTVDDPLVPEIVTTYIQNRQLYERNARAYTEKYAGTSQRLEAYGVTPDMFGEGVALT